MISLNIPGRDLLEIKYLVCDVNGTLTCDGTLLPGVKEQLASLKTLVEIHLVSADTLGRFAEVESALGDIVSCVVRLEPGSEAEQKMEYVEKLGNSGVVAVGQGTNDRLMLKDAGLSICVTSPEGTAIETLLNSDVLVPDILSAFNLLLIPDRLKATLRQ